MDVKQILQSDTDLKKSLLFLYSYQTRDEQHAQTTVEDNGVGFNAFDAEILSSFAQQILKGYELSPKQYNSARLRLPKYARQLSSGAWQEINLPVPRTSNFKKSTYTGILEMDPQTGGVQFKPNVFPSRQIKKIGFTSFVNGAWHQPQPSITQQMVDDILKMFGDNVYIDPEVLKALVPPTVELPDFITSSRQLFQFQKDAIQFALTYKRILLALKPRYGKTVVALHAANAIQAKRILIVAPLSLMFNWRSKIKQWLGEDSVVWYKKQLPIEDRWTITNYETVRLHPQRFNNEKWDLIIVDETVLIKNRNAKRTKVVKELVLNSNPKYVWLLSGAPKTKFMNDLWTQVHILNPKRFSSYWRFVDRYCVIEANQWSKYNIIADRPEAEEQFRKDLQDMYFTGGDQELHLPEWSMEDVPIPLSEYQEKLYASMEEKFLAELPENNKLTASNVLAQMTRLIQIASNPHLIGGENDSPKMVAAIEMLEFEELPAIIWTSYIETASILQDEIFLKRYRVAKLTGATPPDERQKIVDDFQTGKLHVVIAHPGVGKFGLDLGRAKTAIFLERNWFPDDYYQALNRMRHVENKHTPRVIHLLSERKNGDNTVDHVIGKILQASKESTLKLTNSKLKDMFWQKEKR